MNTVSFNASKVAFAASMSTSSWSSDYAMQGAWGSDRRVGLIVFGSMRNSVDWSAQAISQIRLKLRFGMAGASRTGKVLSMHVATRNSAGGRASDAIGSALGDVTLTSVGRSTSSWTCEETITFSEDSNSAIFDALCAWIIGGGTSAIALNSTETASSGNYSWSYLNITAATISIDYELAGSAITVTPTTLIPGATADVTVTPIEAEGTLTHMLRYVVNGASTTITTLAAGVVSYSWAVPDALFTAMRTAKVTTRQITLACDTYDDGNIRGTREVALTLNVPAAAKPEITVFTPRRYGSYIDDQSQTQYRDDVTGVNIWMDIAVSVTAGAAPNCNKASIALYGWPGDDDSQRALIKTFSSNATITSYTLTHSAGMISQTIPLGETWMLELVVDNGYYTVSTQARVHKSTAPLHIAGSGYGVGIGKYSTGTQEDPRFEVAWPAYFEAGITVGNSGWVDLGLASGVSVGADGLGQYPGVGYRVENGNHVYVAASVALRWSQSTTLSAVQLPEALRPARNIYRLCPIDGRWLCRAYVSRAGWVVMEWIQNIAASSASTSAANVEWSDIWIDWFID